MPNDFMPSVDEDRANLLKKLSEITHVNFITEDISLPPELSIALSTHRTDLIRTAPGRALSQEETQRVYRAFAILIETNHLLQSHARETGRLAIVLYDKMAVVLKLLEELKIYATFRSTPDSPKDN